MEPYKVHLDDWTVAMYACDDGRLTFTVSNREGKPMSKEAILAEQGAG